MTVARRRGLWPRALFLVPALLPVFVLLGLVMILVRESVPAVSQLGLGHLFSTRYSGHFSTGQGLYGLLPPIWGTLLVTLLGTLVALPVSLALAILATELPVGGLSRVVGGVLGALSGIPPIIYALMGIVLVRAFIGPKLTGEGLAPNAAAALPGLPPMNAGVLPNSIPNSTFLAGILLGLLVIPVMAPLFQDAIRSVPASLREASLALGANRWYTLRRVVLPVALPGIVSALAIGILTCAGEVVIVTFIVGYEGNLPTPLVDVMERVPVLTATGAGLLGGIGLSAEGLTALDHSVGYFTGLVLLVFAAGTLALAAWMERKLRRRLAQ
jgi:phosphate transport system permease protein